MRWMILSDDFPPLDGGVATWTAAIAAGLHAEGHTVTVFTRRRAGLPRTPHRLVPVPGPSFARLGGWWMAAAAWSHLRSGDRVLATTWPIAAHLVARCRWVRAHLHVACHGSDLTRPTRDPRGLERVLRAARRRWVVSEFLAKILDKMGHSATLLPPPVDLGPMREFSSSAPEHWGYVGRATNLKGGDRFVRLVAAAGVRGTVLGEGPALGRWKALALELGVSRRIDFRGRVSRATVRQWLPGFDLVLLLPRADRRGGGAEGFGLSLVEAAACGVATVGCHTGGVPEAVGAGLVLEDPDDVEGSVRAIRGWWTPERGGACRRWVSERCGVRRAVEALGGG